MKKPPLVSKKRAANIQAFAAALVALCAKHRMALYNSADSGTIDLVECDFTYPDGYEFSAIEGGVSPGGWGYPGEETHQQVTIEEWLPEDAETPGPQAAQGPKV
jgi:hypothetical protein